MTNIINWIEDWFLSFCDKDWEHEYGISIETMDNPGWHIKIDLIDTPLEGLEFDMQIIEDKIPDKYYIEIEGKKYTDLYSPEGEYIGLINKGFWSIKIENNLFIGMGDVKKLNFLLGKFKQLAETGDINTILEADDNAVDTGNEYRKANKETKRDGYGDGNSDPNKRKFDPNNPFNFNKKCP